MKKKNSLHALINAMSRAEKRYFTLDARKSGRKPSRYLQLFQAINSQESYDEDELKAIFGKKLADDKTRLYEAIMRAMRDFRSQKSQTARIKELLLDARYLYERGLYEQANMRLNSASRIASALEDHLSILEINRELRRVLNTLINKEDTDTLNRLIQSAYSSLNKLQSEFENLNVFDQLIREVQRNKSSLKMVDEQQLTSPYKALLFETSPPKSIRAKLRFYQSKAIYCQIHEDKRGVYENFKQAVDCWNSHPEFKQEDFSRYLNDAFNLLHAAYNYSEAINEAPILLEQLSTETPHNISDKANLFQRTATYQIFHAINYGTVVDADEVLLPIKQRLEQFELNPVSELTIRFNGAVLYFIQKRYASCDQWLQGVIEQKSNNLRPDISLSARLMRLLILVTESEYDSFVEAQFRSEQRQLRKTNQTKLRDFGIWLISTLKTYLNLPTDDRKAFLVEMSEVIESDWNQLTLEFNQIVLIWIKEILTTH